MSISTWVTVGLAIYAGLGPLAGYLLGGRNERKRDDRTAAREREALRERQADEGRVFQRDTLLELHDQLYKLNRNTGRASFLDEKRFRETGRYARDQLPEELSDEFSELIGNLNRLCVRIFDQELRELVDNYIKAIIRASISRGHRKDGDDQRERARVETESIRTLAQWGPLEERLGAAIRSQFPGSDFGAAESLPGSQQHG
jgi:hypothetical protein